MDFHERRILYYSNLLAKPAVDEWARGIMGAAAMDYARSKVGWPSLRVVRDDEEE